MPAHCDITHGRVEGELSSGMSASFGCLTQDGRLPTSSRPTEMALVFLQGGGGGGGGRRNSVDNDQPSIPQLVKAPLTAGRSTGMAERPLNGAPQKRPAARFRRSRTARGTITRFAFSLAPLALRHPEGFRTQPHNIEAEQAMLGAILINNRAWDEVSGFLRPEHLLRASAPTRVRVDGPDNPRWPPG